MTAATQMMQGQEGRSIKGHVKSKTVKLRVDVRSDTCTEGLQVYSAWQEGAWRRRLNRLCLLLRLCGLLLGRHGHLQRHIYSSAIQ